MTTEEIYRALGIDPEKIPPKPTVDDHTREAAIELRKIHNMFVKTGFTDDQSFELVKIIFQRSCQ